MSMPGEAGGSVRRSRETSIENGGSHIKAIKSGSRLQGGGRGKKGGGTQNLRAVSREPPLNIREQRWYIVNESKGGEPKGGDRVIDGKRRNKENEKGETGWPYTFS